MERITGSRYSWVVTAISLVFFIIPFFWLNPGEMDLGGDSSRLYFYDPIRYLANQSLFSLSQSAFGGESVSYFGLPFFVLLYLLKSIVQSPTILISAFHGLSLTISFIFCYLTVKELLSFDYEKKNTLYIEAASVLAGLYYNLSPFPIVGWNMALLTHNEVFLNPLLFYLLLRLFITGQSKYIGWILVSTLVFAPNFSYIGAPAFIAFFPLSIIFIGVYTKYIRKTAIPVKKILVGIVLFFLIHAFHIIPQIFTLMSPGSPTHEVIFSDEGKIGRGLDYFLTVAPFVKVSLTWLHLPQLAEVKNYLWLFIFLPAVVVYGFFKNSKKTYLLTGAIFIVIFFFYAANITATGFKLYSALFNIPGFSIFRTSYGRWQWVFLFFYTLLLGQALYIVLHKLPRRVGYILTGGITVLFLTTSWPFINGTLTDTTFWQSRGVKSHVVMDPVYEEVLSYIRSLPVDGKVLSLPLDDHGYQIVKGANDAAYAGPSTITYLTNKSEFKGIAEFGVFQDAFIEAARDKDYEAVQHMLTLFNIKYIFHNSDPYIYEENFPDFPYIRAYDYMPESQQEYQEFIQNLDVTLIQSFNNIYHIYEVNPASYLPHVYVAGKRYYVDQSDDYKLIASLFDTSDVYPAVINTLSEDTDVSLFDGLFIKAHDAYMFSVFDSDQTNLVDHYLIRSAERELMKFNSSSEPWNDILQTYESVMQDVLKDFRNKVIVNQVLNEHESFVYGAIWSSAAVSNQDKVTVFMTAEGIFNRLRQQLNFDVQHISELSYSADIPHAGSYEIVTRAGTQPVDPSDILVGDTTLENGKVELTVGETTITAKNLRYENLFASSDWGTPDGAPISSPAAVFTLEGTPGGDNGLFRPITFKRGALYVISGDYHTHGNNYWINLYEVIENSGSTGENTTRTLFTSRLYSEDWQTFRRVVLLGNKPEAQLFLQISPAGTGTISDPNALPEIELTELTALHLSPPQIIAHHSPLSDNPVKSVPDIVYKKINPTRYEVTVSNASAPYTLVLLDMFNTRWQLLDSQKSTVAQERHYRVNGYANAWDILPIDFENKTDYTIVIEMKTQRIFYYALFLSFVTIASCAVWVVIVGYRKFTGK